MAGFGLEIQRSRHQARMLAVAAPAVDYNLDWMGAKAGERAKCGLDHGLLSVDCPPQRPKGLISAWLRSYDDGGPLELCF